jgi:hypothetical protein
MRLQGSAVRGSRERATPVPTTPNLPARAEYRDGLTTRSAFGGSGPATVMAAAPRLPAPCLAGYVQPSEPAPVTGPDHVALDTLLITFVYAALLAWGVGLGVHQTVGRAEGARGAPQSALPEPARAPALRPAPRGRVGGPVRHRSTHLMHKSADWYWGGRIALLASSLPMAVYFNRPSETYGPLIGRWGLSAISRAGAGVGPVRMRTPPAQPARRSAA